MSRLSLACSAIALALVSSLATGRVALAADAATIELYDKKCKTCHSIGGDAGKMADMGGTLDGVGSKRDAAWVGAYLADPKSKIPDGKMPPVPLTDDELASLVEYMLSLK